MKLIKYADGISLGSNDVADFFQDFQHHNRVSWSTGIFYPVYRNGKWRIWQKFSIRAKKWAFEIMVLGFGIYLSFSLRKNT